MMVWFYAQGGQQVAEQVCFATLLDRHPFTAEQLAKMESDLKKTGQFLWHSPGSDQLLKISLHFH